jgi:hypothetical protein
MEAFGTLGSQVQILPSRPNKNKHLGRNYIFRPFAFWYKNQKRYPNQKILVVEIDNYAYLVPFIEDDKGKFLKTIIPSRKAT